MVVLPLLNVHTDIHAYIHTLGMVRASNKNYLICPIENGGRIKSDGMGWDGMGGGVRE